MDLQFRAVWAVREVQEKFFNFKHSTFEGTFVIFSWAKQINKIEFSVLTKNLISILAWEYTFLLKMG